MKHYLLLDDNQAFAENLAEILRDAGDEATVVTSGAQALEQARSRRFDALLTDMRMPGMGGDEALRRLRQVDPGLAAVVITAHPGESELQKAWHQGVLAVLPKPVPLPALMQVLAEARRDAMVAVVEDDPSLQDNLAEALRAHGFTCLTARSVPDTERLPTSELFAAVVDLRVPGGVDGEAVHRLRDRFPEVPVFIITAHPEFHLMPLARVATGFFAKPFDVQALLSALQQTYDVRRPLT